MGMLANERYSIILELLSSCRAVTISELEQVLKTSSETIRRDLIYLEQQKSLQRVHGGAVSIGHEKPFQSLLHRKNENVELKRELVRTAACLVNDGDTIIVDSGSTANEFILTLCSGFRALSVITHSMTVFEALHNAPGIRIILIGGEYLKSEECFFGAIALECLHQLHATTSFIFPSAISLKYGVADYSSELIPIQKKYLEISNHTVILADSSKFEKTALMKICSTDNSHIYVTDSLLDDNIYKLYRENGIRVCRNKEEIDNESKSIINIG